MRSATASRQNLDIRFTRWRRAGLIAFGFFFTKGLIRLALPLMLYWLG